MKIVSLFYYTNVLVQPNIMLLRLLTSVRLKYMCLVETHTVK